jgi:tRNA threonylcarbamoyl adenosine modification protein YeaZ
LIVAISCSSPVVSVALLEPDGTVLFSGRQDGGQKASETALLLLSKGLESTRRLLSDADLFVADVGPGSFIGVRVSVTLAKTLAFAVGAKAAGVSSFDLIACGGDAVVPSKRGEYFVRRKGKEPERTNELPNGESFKGYGAAMEETVHPDAVRAASLLRVLIPIRPEELTPQYLIEPSISTPKRPYTTPA